MGDVIVDGVFDPNPVFFASQNVGFWLKRSGVMWKYVKYPGNFLHNSRIGFTLGRKNN
jgi:hypothetical protein